MSVEEMDGGWRPTYETCWQCKKRVRSDQAICVWCGATRVPQATRNHMWTPPEPGGEYSRRAPGSGTAYGAPPMQQGAAPFSEPGGADGSYGMATDDFGQQGGRSPLGVAVPQTGGLIDPYQSAAPAHPYQFQPYQQAQTPGDWRLPPAPAQSYVPSTGPLAWDGDLSERGQMRPTGEDADVGEDTLEHPELPRQAPPMQQLGRVRLVQENQGNGQSARRRDLGESDTPRAHRSVPLDRGMRQAPHYEPQPDQQYGYAPPSGAAQGDGYAVQSGPAQGYGHEPTYQPGYPGGYGPGYGPGQPGYGPGYEPGQPDRGQQPSYQSGYQSGYNPGYASGQQGYSYQPGYDPSYGYDQSGYGYQPGYDYGDGYPGRAREQEPPAGYFQQIVDLTWDAVHAEEALAWIEAKVRRVLPYVQQFAPMAEPLAPDKNMTSRRVLNLLSPIGLGCLGGFIGAVIWCSAVTAIHVEIGIFAIPMAYLIGWGVTMGSLRRGLTPALLALVITLGAWAICLAIISHLHLYITPMEIPFLLGALVAAVVPTRSIKRERWEKRR